MQKVLFTIGDRVEICGEPCDLNGDVFVGEHGTILDIELKNLYKNMYAVYATVEILNYYRFPCKKTVKFITKKLKLLP